MSTDAELIKRLRSMSCYDYAAACEAAERLAALIAERDRLKQALAPFADAYVALATMSERCDRYSFTLEQLVEAYAVYAALSPTQEKGE